MQRPSGCGVSGHMSPLSRKRKTQDVEYIMPGLQENKVRGNSDYVFRRNLSTFRSKFKRFEVISYLPVRLLCWKLDML